MRPQPVTPHASRRRGSLGSGASAGAFSSVRKGDRLAAATTPGSCRLSSSNSFLEPRRDRTLEVVGGPHRSDGFVEGSNARMKVTQVADLSSGHLVAEGRHPRPLAFQDAHDQLRIRPARLPGSDGKVGDGRQALPDHAPLAVGSMAHGHTSAGTRRRPVRWLGSLGAEAGPVRDLGGLDRQQGLPRLSSTTSLPLPGTPARMRPSASRRPSPVCPSSGASTSPCPGGSNAPSSASLCGDLPGRTLGEIRGSAAAISRPASPRPSLS